MQPQLQSAASTTKSAPESGWQGFGRGLGRGLLPLLILSGGIAVTFALTVTARELAAPFDVAVSQWVVVAVFVLGLVIVGTVYGIALVRTFRRWRDEERESGPGGPERNASSAGMLWALIVTAVVVALPVIVSALVPQHPAP